MGRPRPAAARVRWVVTGCVLSVALASGGALAAPITQMGAASPPVAPTSAPEPSSPATPAAPTAPPAPAASDSAAPAGAANPHPATSGPPAAAAAAIVTPPPAPVPTADAEVAASDHDLVVGHWGIEARRLSPGPYALTLRPSRGCPSTAPTPCTVEMGLLGVRYWWNRNAALDVGAALAVGGGREGTRTLDTYAGGGLQLGLSLLLGNWRHLAVAASPELGVFLFKPGGDSTSSTVIVQFAATLEGELHFGFLGVPALSVGMATGVAFHYEDTPDARVWSIGVVGPESAWGVLTDLFVRYYL